MKSRKQKSQKGRSLLRYEIIREPFMLLETMGMSCGMAS